MAAKSNLLNMVLVLGATCLLCSAVLGFAYVLTEEPIKQAADTKQQATIAQVLPAFSQVEFNQEGNYYKAWSDTVTVGYAIISKVNGFGGPLTLLVGITTDGIIYNTSVLSHSETPGLGAKCTSDKKFLAQWEKLDPSVKTLSVTKDGGSIDAITASTITSRAYTKAVADALATFRSIVEPSNETVENGE